jgi:hypothetical protein
MIALANRRPLFEIMLEAPARTGGGQANARCRLRLRRKTP